MPVKYQAATITALHNAVDQTHRAKVNALAAVVHSLRPHLSYSWAEAYARYTANHQEYGAGHYAYTIGASNHDQMIWRDTDNITEEEKKQIAAAHALLFL